jgi:hypothetical protein
MFFLFGTDWQLNVNRTDMFDASKHFHHQILTLLLYTLSEEALDDQGVPTYATS